jgi:2-phosphoglycerate kinase
MICGTPRVCKSIIATYLAERLNISNMLQTSIVEMMMKLIDEDRFFKDCDLFAEEDEERIIEKYMNRSRAIKQGVGSDINKALTDGKPVIIEGYELVPELYVRLKSTEVDDSPGEAENGSISKAED